MRQKWTVEYLRRAIQCRADELTRAVLSFRAEEVCAVLDSLDDATLSLRRELELARKDDLEAQEPRKAA